jgi:hypothetical protein
MNALARSSPERSRADTYLGYHDSQGYYRNCIQSAPPPAEAPQRVVQTY